MDPDPEQLDADQHDLITGDLRLGLVDVHHMHPGISTAEAEANAEANADDAEAEAEADANPDAEPMLILMLSL